MFSTGSTKVCMYYLIKARQRVERLTLCPSTFLLPVLSHGEVLPPSQSCLILALWSMVYIMQLFPTVLLFFFLRLKIKWKSVI